MYGLLSSQVVIENLITLALPYVTNKNNLNKISLKQAYRNYLSDLQPHCSHIQNPTLFHADAETENAFADYFINEEIDIKNVKRKVDLDKVLYPNPLERRQILEKVLLDLEKIDSDFVELFKLVMNTVFCTVTKKLGGTSVNTRYIGVMCAYYDMNAEEKAIPELFIHEFTHQALFLDELRYGHYHYQEMKNPKTHCHIHYAGYQYTVSFQRCLHSLMVATEILLARDAYIGHQPRITQHLETTEIIKRANIYIDSIQKNKWIDSVMTDRSRMLLSACEDFYRARENPGR